ncbi:MAG: hypothetical protein R3F59_05250 [Myxococcota bacterium]
MLAGLATQRIVSRAVWWGAWGGVLGAGTFAGIAALGWLRLPWPATDLPTLIVLGVLYVAAGIGCWGHAGLVALILRWAI